MLALLLLSACAADSGSDSSRARAAPAAGDFGNSDAADSTGPGDDDFGNSAAGAQAPAPQQILNPGGGDCTPGHYVGVFDGTYNSAAWGNGAAPLTVEAVEFAGLPGLEFWLQRVEKECTAEEFCGDFSVKGGKIRGFANPFVDPNAPAGTTSLLEAAIRFEIDLVGELDCTRGQFKGQLQNGCYDVATVLYRFEGTLESPYDRAASAFDDGIWEVAETPMAGVLFPPDASIGGSGSWTAAFSDDSAPPAEGSMGLCDGMTGFDTPVPAP